MKCDGTGGACLLNDNGAKSVLAQLSFTFNRHHHDTQLGHFARHDTASVGHVRKKSFRKCWSKLNKTLRI